MHYLPYQSTMLKMYLKIRVRKKKLSKKSLSSPQLITPAVNWHCLRKVIFSPFSSLSILMMFDYDWRSTVLVNILLMVYRHY